MKAYVFEVRETLASVITVEAESSEAAYSLVSQMYNNEEIVLSADDYVDTDIRELGDD